MYCYSAASDLNWPLVKHRNSSGPSEDGSDSTRSKRKRSFIPDDRKDNKYWERRKKNNIAAKKCRKIRKKREDEQLRRAEAAIQENNKFKAEIEVLKNEVSSLRRLLRDANMTLALWIKARQSNENPLQMSLILPKPDRAYSFMPCSQITDSP